MTNDELRAEIDRLQWLGRRELIARYPEYLKNLHSCPSLPLLRDLVAMRLQQEPGSELRQEVVECLDSAIRNGVGSAKRNESECGMRVVRSWAGRDYAFHVRPNGIVQYGNLLFRSKQHASRMITGKTGNWKRLFGE